MTAVTTNDAALELTNLHLGRRQKAALRERARARGTSLAEEVRAAIDTYLSGITPEAMELLDAASANAERELQAMVRDIDATNARVDAVFAEIEELRRQAGERA